MLLFSNVLSLARLVPKPISGQGWPTNLSEESCRVLCLTAPGTACPVQRDCGVAWLAPNELEVERDGARLSAGVAWDTQVFASICS